MRMWTTSLTRWRWSWMKLKRTRKLVTWVPVLVRMLVMVRMTVTTLFRIRIVIPVQAFARSWRIYLNSRSGSTFLQSMSLDWWWQNCIIFCDPRAWYLGLGLPFEWMPVSLLREFLEEEEVYRPGDVILDSLDLEIVPEVWLPTIVPQRCRLRRLCGPQVALRRLPCLARLHRLLCLPPPRLPPARLSQP